jgi:hypothetical protein
MNSSLNLFISLNLRKFYYDLYLYYLLNPYPSTFQSIIIQSYIFSFPSICHYHLVLVPVSHKFPILCFPSKPQSQTNEEKRDGMSQIIMLNHWLMMFLSPQSVRMDSKHFLATEGMIMTYWAFLLLINLIKIYMDFLLLNIIWAFLLLI